MRLIALSLFLLLIPSLSFAKDYKEIYLGNEVQWETSAAELADNFNTEKNILWFGKVEATQVYSNQEGVTSIEWLCSQFPFVNPSVEALADPIIVKKQATGYFVISLILPTLTQEEAKKNILNEMKEPTYALVSGVGVYVKKVGNNDAVFLKSEKLIFSDDFAVQFQ